MQSIMRTRSVGAILATVLCLGSFVSHSFAALSLPEAEKLAMGGDPVVSQRMANSRALSEKAIAQGSWKDPRLKLGILAIPLDSFDMKQEGMTQRIVGVQQGFPRGNSLRIKKEQTLSMAQGERVKADMENQTLLRDVRIAYMSVIYRQKAYQTVLKSRDFFKQLVEIAEFRYSSGKGRQQKVLEASLALSGMEDKLLKIKNMEDLARVKLANWIPKVQAFGKIPLKFPELKSLPDRSEMTPYLSRHPSIKLAEINIKNKQLGLLHSKEQYKPGWMLDTTYGWREGENPNKTSRSDLFSIMVSVDIPLFTKNRQDRVQRSNQIQIESAEFARDDRLRTLETLLETFHADYVRLEERLQLFSTLLVPESEQYTETTLTAYQSRVADLTDVVRAHLAELTIRLDLLEVYYMRLVNHAKLLFVLGEVK